MANPPTRNRVLDFKPIFVLILAFGLLSFPVLASFTDEWGEYQDDPSNRGFVHDETANYDDGLGITYFTNKGSSYQPLIINITGTNDLETIIFSGNFLKIYDTQLNLIDERNMGATVQGQPTIYNNGTHKIILGIIDDKLEAWTYNGAFVDAFSNSTKLNQTFVCGTWTGIKCENNCHTLCSDGTNTHTYSINMSNDSWIQSSLSPNAVKGVPAIQDIDRDGKQELVIDCDANGDGDYGICVIDLNNSLTPYLDTSFSADGILDDIADASIIANPTIFNINGAGDSEILMSYLHDATNTFRINTYLSDGSLDWFMSFPGPGTATTVGQAFILDNGSTQFIICASATDNLGGGAYQYKFQCADYQGNPVIINQRIAGFNAEGTTGIPNIAADMNTDGIDEVITPFGIYHINMTEIINFTTIPLAQINALADVDRDGELEVISVNSNNLSIIKSSFTNQPPEVNNTMNFGGYGANLDYQTPICVGSTLTFNAQETGGVVTGNYDNDGSSDQERIVSNCGQLPGGSVSSSFTNDLNNGTSSGANPNFACVYNVTGIFSVRLFLQDQANLVDFTEYNTQTITVQVLNGTAGITCNLGSALGIGDAGAIPASAQESQTNEAIEDTLGILFGTGAGSDKLKLIVGLALVLGIIAAAYREGVKDGVGITIVAGISIIMVTFIGLLTPAILIIGIAILVLVLFLGRALTGSPNGGA